MYGLDFTGSMIVLGVIGGMILLPVIGEAVADFFRWR